VTPAAVKSADYLSGMNIFPPSLPSEMPSTLAPTALQRQICHPAYINAATLATLRDNLIRALGSFDDDALCLNLLVDLFYGDSGPENNGIMVWTDPWDVSGWEMTEEFVRRWDFF
jgi:Domain of unknown function (DUF3425)